MEIIIPQLFFIKLHFSKINNYKKVNSQCKQLNKLIILQNKKFEIKILYKKKENERFKNSKNSCPYQKASNEQEITITKLNRYHHNRK